VSFRSDGGLLAGARAPCARLVAVVIAAVSLACAAAHPVPPEAAERARAETQALAREYLEAWFRYRPEDGTAFGFPGADPSAVQDVTPAALRAWEAIEDRLLARVRAVDARALAGTPEAVTRGVLLEALEASRGVRVCRMELWSVSSVNGWQGEYAALAEVQPVGTPALRAAAVARVTALARRVDAEVENLREGARLGYVATRENVARAAAELDRLLATPAASWPQVAPAERDGDPAFKAALTSAVEHDLAPAAERYRAHLRYEYVDRARRKPSLLAHPDGEACYRASVRLHTTLDLDPAAVQSTGLARVKAIQAELRAVADRTFGGAGVPALLRRLRDDPALRFASADEVMAVSRGAVTRAQAAAPRWFGRVPAAPVELRPYPGFLRGSAPAERYSPDFSGGKLAGLYQVDALEPAARPRPPVEANVFHETVPGHHLQLAVALERGGAGVGRYVLNSGFVEGWALYSERLADEMGLYSGDLDRLGFLANQAFRAARLVVDPGLNLFGWPRQRAIDYLVANAGLPEERAAAEVDRYVAWPGQATAYALGALELQALRADAERALGARFDVRAFHDAVLEDGAVPLPLLREKVTRWVAERAAR
jgi:uncharacterized protein (DUF885 family)